MDSETLNTQTLNTDPTASAVSAASAAPARNYGIDLLRLVSMFYIVALHILLQGGAMYATTIGSATYYTAHYLEIVIYAGANIFALISGYVGVSEKEKPIRLASYLQIWLEVVFYGIAAMIFYCLDGNTASLTAEDVYGVFFPVFKGSYWYFSAYTGLFLFLPVLSAGIRSASKESLRNVFIAMILIFAFLGQLFTWMGIGSGYSMLWLVILYILGAIMKKCDIGKRWKTIPNVAGIAVLSLIGCIWKIKNVEVEFASITIENGFLTKYTSIIIVMIAVLNVVIFANAKLPDWLVHVTKFAAPASFAVYLINCQPLIWNNYFKNAFFRFGSMKPLMFLICVIGSALLFVTGAILIDRIRIALFELLRVKKFCAWIETKCRAGLAAIGKIL